MLPPIFSFLGSTTSSSNQNRIINFIPSNNNSHTTFCPSSSPPPPIKTEISTLRRIETRVGSTSIRDTRMSPNHLIVASLNIKKDRVSPMDLLIAFERLLDTREHYEETRNDLLHISTMLSQQSSYIPDFKKGIQTLQQRLLYINGKATRVDEMVKKMEQNIFNNFYKSLTMAHNGAIKRIIGAELKVSIRREGGIGGPYMIPSPLSLPYISTNETEAKMEVDRDNECVICRNKEITIEFLPCKHRCSCRRCYARLQLKWGDKNSGKNNELFKICPFCREYVENIEYLV